MKRGSYAQKEEDKESVTSFQDSIMVKAFRKFCIQKRDEMRGGAGRKGTKSRTEIAERGKKIFKVYYDIRNEEKHVIDISSIQFYTETQCYAGNTKISVLALEYGIIRSINEKRLSEARQPIMIHEDIHAVFDITVEEIEEKMKIQVAEEMATPENLRTTKEAENILSRCLFDFLEDRYVLMYTLDEECLDEQETTDMRRQYPTGDYTLPELIRSVKCLNHKLKQEKMELPDYEKEVEFMKKERETCIKAIMLIKQVERLKKYRETNTGGNANGMVVKILEATYKFGHIERIRILEEAMEILNTYINTELYFIAMEAMHDEVDEFYQILIELRRRDGKAAPTMHEIRGTFDITLEEVENGLRYLDIQAIREGEVIFSTLDYAPMFLHQLECRFYYVMNTVTAMEERAGITTTQATV